MSGDVSDQGGYATKLRANCGQESADPGLTVPVRPKLAAARELEVELLRLDEPGRREHPESVCGVDELELARGRLRVGLERERAAATAPRGLRPDVDGASLCLDVLSDVGLRNELHRFKSRLRGCATELGRL